MKKKPKKIRLIIEQTKTRFSAYAVGLAIASPGNTVAKLMENALEAANLYFEEQKIPLAVDNLEFIGDFK